MKVYEGGRVPIKSWASEIDQSAIDQAMNAANLPFAISHIALAPDAHPGYGVPIGSVLFADNAIVPYAVGVDIGCGVALLDLDMNVDEVQPDLQAFLDAIAASIPVGNGPDGGRDRIDRRFAFDGDPPYHGSLVALQAIEVAERQLGSLGGGNHFIEVQADPDGKAYVMLHSGSRSVGKKICDYWHKRALELNEKWHSELPHKDLAYLPWGTDEARGYFDDMNLAMSWAEQNRAHMLADVREASFEVFGGDHAPAVVTDIHHNYAAWENHLGRNGIVHRKGAVRAHAGETVLIPGSMGTASYVATGLGNVSAFKSCQHGAGRARSRSATLKLETEEQFTASLAGILLGGKAAQARDESPFAYKDVEVVMADAADLVTNAIRMRPLGVVKG